MHRLHPTVRQAGPSKRASQAHTTPRIVKAGALDAIVDRGGFARSAILMVDLRKASWSTLHPGVGVVGVVEVAVEKLAGVRSMKSAVWGLAAV